MNARGILQIILIMLTSHLSMGEGLPASYKEFERKAEELVAPLVPLMEEGKSTLPIEGPASDHGKMADELESVARPGLLLSLWLQMEPLPESEREYEFSREEVASWYREALVMGTDREHPEYWGELMNYHQHGVEMAIMTMSLTLAREWIWEPLSKSEKDQVASWFGEMRGTARYWNNHLFFSILVMEWLRSEGYEKPGDGESIAFMFELLESMHMGGGWFKDGINETYDHYNAYAFHTYGLYWIWKYGHTAPERARMWRQWAHSFTQDYAHFFAASGEHIPYGRSITYRFNSLGIFGLAAQTELGALPLGEMRRISRKNLEYFLGHPIEQSQGALSIGWTDEFQGIREPYSTAGSPYWAAKGLMMLTLPPEHAFWHEEEQAYPSERGDFVRVINAPRFVLRGIDGKVELLNAGSQVSRGNAERYGPWKWSKIAYRTGHGFLVSDDLYEYPLDAALTLTRKNGQRFGRHPTIPVEAAADHMAYFYALGTRDDNFNAPVRTDVFWRDQYLLVIHQVESFEPVKAAHGGFALGLNNAQEGKDETTTNPLFITVHSPDQSSSIQEIYGFEKNFPDKREEGEPRQHLTEPYHITPVLQGDWQTGKQVYAAIFWTASKEEEPVTAWEIQQTDKGHWRLEHPRDGVWEIRHPELPGLER